MLALPLSLVRAHGPQLALRYGIDPYVLPLVKVENRRHARYDDGYDAFWKLVGRRVAPIALDQAFEGEALDDLIRYSGGHPRLFLRFLTESLAETGEALPVGMGPQGPASDDPDDGPGRPRRVGPKLAALELSGQQRVDGQEPDVQQMLDETMVLEYLNGDAEANAFEENAPWFAVHPILRELQSSRAPRRRSLWRRRRGAMSLPNALEEGTRDEELARLARALRLARGFRLYFARSLPGEPRRELLDALADLVEGVWTFDAPAGLDHLRAALASRLAEGPEPRAICATGIETWVPAGDVGARSAFVRHLNVSRDRFAETVSFPLVIWAADHVLRAIQHGAPDFFSVASGIYLFPDAAPGVAREARTEPPTLVGTASWLRELTEVDDRLEALGRERSGTALADRIGVLNRKVVLLLMLAHYGEAERWAGEVYQEARSALGEGHPDTLMSANNLAYLYRSMGRYAEAEPLYAATLEARRRTLGEEHPDTLASANNLAHLYLQTGRSAPGRRPLNSLVDAASRLPEGHEVRRAIENNLRAWRD